MAGVSGQIAGGQLLLPPDAPWLVSFKTELLGFPFARYDDQADALPQLTNWTLRFRDDYSIDDNSGPIIFVYNDDGPTEILGDYDGIFSSNGPLIQMMMAGEAARVATPAADPLQTLA